LDGAVRVAGSAVAAVDAVIETVPCWA